MSHKKATLAAAGVLSLIVLANDKLAGAVEQLTDAQMDLIAAGTWTFTGTVGQASFVLTDARGYTYTYQPSTNKFLDNHGGVWEYPTGTFYTYNSAPGSADGTAIGLLVNKAAGQVWDGGLSSPGPRSCGKCGA